jgi:hypothetical protein
MTEQFDWAHDPDNDPNDTLEYHKIDKTVGRLAYKLLDALSQDITALESDSHGWTEADAESLSLAQETDWLSRLLVPPDTVSPDARVDFMKELVSFRTALPLAEAERDWLLDGYRPGKTGESLNIASPEWRETTRKSENQLVSAGISRVVYGRDLLQRWWSWRRETGEYAGQGSLDQARYALEGVIGLIAPELGLPEAYVALRATGGDQSMS